MRSRLRSLLLYYSYFYKQQPSLLIAYTGNIIAQTSFFASDFGTTLAREPPAPDGRGGVRNIP